MLMTETGLAAQNHRPNQAKDMNYEIAMQLKDAGFPQLGDYAFVKTDFVDKESTVDVRYVGGMHPTSLYQIDIVAFSPTLEELIEACGDKFRRVFVTWLPSATWHAESYPEYVGRGSTSSEAVGPARLTDAKAASVVAPAVCSGSVPKRICRHGCGKAQNQDDSGEGVLEGGLHDHHQSYCPRCRVLFLYAKELFAAVYFLASAPNPPLQNPRRGMSRRLPAPRENVARVIAQPPTTLRWPAVHNLIGLPRLCYSQRTP
jgi:hypothetical protein